MNTLPMNRASSTTHLWRAWPLLPILVLGMGLLLAGCDQNDGGWEQPVDPGANDHPELLLTVDYTPAQDDHVNEGETLLLSVQLANEGSAAADGIEVSVGVPAALTFQEALASQGLFDDPTGIWSVGRLEAGGLETLTITTLVPEGSLGTLLRFGAGVTASSPADSTRSDNSDTLQVSVVNSPPDADDDSYVVLEGAILTVGPPGLLTNDLDIEGETVTVDTVFVDAPMHGSLTLEEDGGFQYWHDGSEALADSFRYRITDTSSEADTAMVRMQIVLVNDTPDFHPFPDFTISEGETFEPVDLAALAYDNDDPTEDLTWQVFGGTDLDVSLDNDHILTVLVPDEEWNGSESLVFRVRDPHGAHRDATVAFTVLPVNDPPVMAILPSQVVSVGGNFLPIPLDSFVADVDHADDQMAWTYSDNAPLEVQIDAQRVMTVAAPDGWTGSVTMMLRATDPDGAYAERSCHFEVTEVR